MFKQEWHNRLSQSTRAIFYTSIKDYHSYSKYLDIIKSSAHLTAFIKLVMSSHNLHIEAGRWTRPVTPAGRRNCSVCENKLEDEFHFILECPLYTERRSLLIPRYYRIRPSMFKLVQLFNSSEEKVVKDLAKYIFIAFKIRSNNITEI